MESRQSIKETLEGFSAVLLATDPSDKQAVKEVQESLREASQSVRSEEDADRFARVGQSLDLAIEALETVLADDLSDATAAFDAVTNTVAATAEQVDLQDEQEQTQWLSEAADQLRGILDTAGTGSAATEPSSGDFKDLSEAADAEIAETEFDESETTDAELADSEIAADAEIAEIESADDEPAEADQVTEEPETSAEDNAELWSLPADSDMELLGEFSTECFDRIAQAEASLLELETNVEDDEQISEIFRSFHTIKGTSGFLELNAIQKLAHLAENLLDRAREGEIKIVGGYADLSLQSCDMLREMIDDVTNVEPGGTLPKPNNYDQLISNLTDPEAAGFSGVAANAVAVLEQLAAAADAEADEDSAEMISEESAAEEPTARKQAAAKSDADSSIRVSTARLDSLINMAGELVIAHSMVAQDATASGQDDGRLAKNVAHSGKIIREVQDLAMALRMVPLKGAFRKMARMVRDLGRKAGKTVRFHTEGEETEIDRNMVEAISDPLVHMIRNSMDHGIEDTQTRVEAGKDATGTVSLRAYHSAGNVVIELHDDGKGLDREAIIAKAVDRGIIESGRALSDREAFGLIFHAGLSTAKKITNISGRGVGMDVVKNSIEALNGRVEVDSQLGQGTTITLRLPLTMAISDAMLLGVGEERFLLPIPFIANTFRPEQGSVSTIGGRREVVPFQEQLLPMFRLHDLFGLQDAQTDPYQGLVVVIEAEGGRCALLVDAILGQHQVVIKSLGPVFGQVSGISGGAILGDGRIGLILDAAGILKLAKGSEEDYPSAQDTIAMEDTEELRES